MQDNAADGALAELLEQLRARGYSFVTTTPASHARVLARADKETASTLRDVLGWTLPYRSEAIDPEIMRMLDRAEVVSQGPAARCRIRVSSLGETLFLHSPYPTNSPDAVFFGPDSYRFAQLIEHEVSQGRPSSRARIADIGTGAGVGAIVAGQLCPDAEIVMTDINPEALRFAGINARAAGVAARPVLCKNLDAADGPFDLILANPPYIIDAEKRAYRDGGAMHGGALSVEMTRAALDRLAPGGRFILYTGAAITEGEDALRIALGEEAERAGITLRYRELDPDIFGEELGTEAYRSIDRIAVVSAIFTRSM